MTLNQKQHKGNVIEGRTSSTSSDSDCTHCSDEECDECELRRAKGKIRPKLHTALASTLYDNAIKVANCRRSPPEKWYRIDLKKLSLEVREHWIQLSPDADTQAFLDNCFAKSENLGLQMYHSLATSVLWLVPRLSQTGMNGLLGRGSMFILGTDAYSRLLGLSPRRDASLTLPVGHSPASTSTTSQSLPTLTVPLSPPTAEAAVVEVDTSTGPFGRSSESSSRAAAHSDAHSSPPAPARTAALTAPSERALDIASPAADNRSAQCSSPECPVSASASNFTSTFTSTFTSASTSATVTAAAAAYTCASARVLLDIGAGDGNVTSRLAPLFDEVHATESSGAMCWRLSRAGFRVLGVDDWQRTRTRYALISCLNVLDRCARPVSLLRAIRECLLREPDADSPAAATASGASSSASAAPPASTCTDAGAGVGRLLLAVVLPFSQYVEAGSSHEPNECLLLRGTGFEAQLSSLYADVLRPLGFELEAAARAPYLCEGDLSRPYYYLHDALLVLRPVRTPVCPGAAPSPALSSDARA